MPIAQAASVFPEIAPWPTQTAPAPIGHNKPPVEDEAKAAFREQLLTDRPDFEQRLDDLVANADKVPERIEDDETCGKAGDLLKLYRAAAAHISTAHERAKEPYLKGGRVCDAEKRGLIERLDGARLKVQPKLDDYAARQLAARRAEEARAAAEQRRMAEEAAAAERARQQAERAREEALKAGDEEAAAAVVVPEPVAYQAPTPSSIPARGPIRSDAGATVSASTVWQSRVVDYLAAFKAVKDDSKVREAIDAAIQRQVKAGKREIKGVEVFETARAVAR